MRVHDGDDASGVHSVRHKAVGQIITGLYRSNICKHNFNIELVCGVVCRRVHRKCCPQKTVTNSGTPRGTLRAWRKGNKRAQPIAGNNEVSQVTGEDDYDKSTFTLPCTPKPRVQSTQTETHTHTHIHRRPHALKVQTKVGHRFLFFCLTIFARLLMVLHSADRYRWTYPEGVSIQQTHTHTLIHTGLR